MTRLHLLVIACAIGFACLLPAAQGFARMPELPFAGGCELTKKGAVSYRGTCAVLRSQITAETTGGRCTGEVITLRIPGRDEVTLLRGTGPDCSSTLLGSPVTFIAEDSQGWFVVSTAAGRLLRFEPGPPPGLPVLDDFLAGLDGCDPAPGLRRFFENLSDSYAVSDDTPDGPVAASGGPVIWPPGGFLAPELVAARKIGTRMRIVLALRGTYLGLPLSRLQFDFHPEARASVELRLVFQTPRAGVVARIGEAVDLAERMAQVETGDRNRALLAAGEPGTLVCVLSD